ncbi:MAG: transglutaminase-like cysteine peptidase [Candidatus Bathyarchaeota archaeon]|jgi:transglutaminase-like putative cysteine protease|nr:transglutaminase-like cysteine peptidase [Candidatus Bathyarchaeota archaeon]
MNKTIIGFIIIVVVLLFAVAPFTFRDQIQSFLSLISNNSQDQTDQDSGPELNIVDENVLRVFDETLCYSFITPQDPSVVNLRDEILQDNLALLTPDWMALRDWVGNRIQYKSDSEIHNEREYWQFSNETIYLETGDCEDFSILLCSLLRSNGWTTDSVYVVIGEQNNQHHAWVRLIWNDMQYNIEPQGSGFEIFIGDMTNLSGFEAIFYFNDQDFGAF